MPSASVGGCRWFGARPRDRWQTSDVLEASAASGRALRVGFMTPFDVHDPRAWSGVVAPMFAALAHHVELVHLPVPDRRPHVVDRALARFLGRRYLPNVGLASSHSLG